MTEYVLVIVSDIANQPTMYLLVTVMPRFPQIRKQNTACCPTNQAVYVLVYPAQPFGTACRTNSQSLDALSIDVFRRYLKS